MTQRVTVTLEDDIDGGPADETVRFGLDGTPYEIDLSSENAKRLREMLGTYAGHASRTRGSAPPSGRRLRRDRAGQPERQRIREWAAGRGLMKADSRGRISAYVLEQWEAHQPGAQAAPPAAPSVPEPVFTAPSASEPGTDAAGPAPGSRRKASTRSGAGTAGTPKAPARRRRTSTEGS